MTAARPPAGPPTARPRDVARPPARSAGARAACARATTFLLAIATCAAPARGREFEPPAPPCEPGTAAALDRGLAPAAGGASLACLAGRRFGLAELGERGVAAGFGAGALRAAAGWARSGDESLGWDAAGVALGVARDGGGAALRAVARRERAAAAAAGTEAGPLGAGVGAEAGFGAWLAPRPGWRAWAAAPQVWTRGAAPPLARGLEIGVAAAADGLAAWLVRRSVPGAAGTAGDAGAHAAGISLEAGPARAWLEGMDRPARAAIGLAARAGALEVAARVEAHPVLRESAWLALTLGRAGPP
uniref:Uncharacterized protein n=1 Tax=Eiseniibacteriota bacterium TaxID=2212470 RepID=A0A832I601_UNCEI